ncbi:MAG TPA: hypothetical protein VGR47_17960 [Terracidiphilus sp.]|nr:hypothetical protein [Terracidiphilus sp.]
MIGKVQPYTPPKINQLPPNYRENKWALVREVQAPFAGDPPPREFGFWFNYFWDEVIRLPNITPLQQQKAAETFFSVFQGQQAPFTVRPDFAGRDDAFKENVLRQLLLIGFRRVALEMPRLTQRAAGLQGQKLAPPPLVANDVFAQLQELNLEQLVGKRGEAVPIAFRADGRCYEELCQHKGFRTRARSKDSPIHSIYALDRPWNPFSNPVYSNSLFLRLGSKNADNCLQTVISIGAEFAGITHFPILSDCALVFQAKSADGRFLALKPLDEWTPQDENIAKSHSQKVRAVRLPAGGEIDHLEKDNYIYAFHLRNVKVFNTREYFTRRGDTPFNERGAAEIPLENLLAEVHFVQKWFYSPDDRQIMLYELVFDPIRWVPSQPYVDVVIGEKARLDLEAKILAEIGRARARREITVEMTKYVAFQAQKARMLSGTERQKVCRALKTYLNTPGAVKTTRAEKAAVRLALVGDGASPAFLAKFDAIDPGDWNEKIRSETRKLA